MSNYMKAEISRNIKRKYFLSIIMIASIMCLAFWGLLYINSVDEIGFDFAFEAGINFLNIPMYMTIMFSAMVTGEDIRDNTIKNTIAMGKSRTSIVIEKILSTIILALIAAVVILAVYFISGFMASSGFLTRGVEKEFLIKLLSLLPIWVGAISISTFTEIIAKSGLTSGVLFLGLVSYIVPNFVWAIGRTLNQKWIIWISENMGISENIMTIINQSDLKSGLKTGIIIGTIYFVIFTTLSIICFNKKEI